MKYACPECLREITPPVNGRALHVEDGSPCCVELTQPEAFEAVRRAEARVKNREKPIFMATGVNCMPIYLTVEADGSVSLLADEGYYNAAISPHDAARLSDAIRRRIMAKVVKPDRADVPRSVARNLTVAASRLSTVAEDFEGEQKVVLMELAYRITHASDVLYAFLDGKDLPKCDG